MISLPLLDTGESSVSELIPLGFVLYVKYSELMS